jgi:hypothetical protein
MVSGDPLTDPGKAKRAKRAEKAETAKISLDIEVTER